MPNISFMLLPSTRALSCGRIGVQLTPNCLKSLVGLLDICEGHILGLDSIHSLTTCTTDGGSFAAS